MQEFTMSQFATKEELYKAKSEYFENRVNQLEAELKKHDDTNNKLLGVLTTAGTDADTNEPRVIISVSKEQLMSCRSLLYKQCIVTILDVVPASA